MVPWKPQDARRWRRINRIRKSQSVPSFPQYAAAAANQQHLTSQHSYPAYVNFDPSSIRGIGNNLFGQSSYESPGEFHEDDPQRQDSSVHLADTFLGNSEFEEEEEGNPNPIAGEEATSTQGGQYNSTRGESEPIEVGGGPGIEQYPKPIPKSEIPHLILRERQKRIEYLPLHVRLYQAALKGDWRIAKSVIDICPLAVRVAIAGGSETALHISAAAKQTAFVGKLVERMSSTDMLLKNKHGNTALCFAAASGIVKIAEVMVKRNKDLPLIRGCNDVTPLFMAVTYKRKDMVNYLFSVTEFELLKTEEQIGLLIATISTDYYDVGLKILQKNPRLAIMKSEDNETALHVMARKPSAIGSRSQLNIWEKCINFC